jgi:hypothetical protein
VQGKYSKNKRFFPKSKLNTHDEEEEKNEGLSHEVLDASTTLRPSRQGLRLEERKI